jgi:hypothetical protein
MSAERDRPNSIADRFAAAVGIDADAFPELELLPVRLTRACVQVLPVAGAGLSALAKPRPQIADRGERRCRRIC